MLSRSVHDCMLSPGSRPAATLLMPNSGMQTYLHVRAAKIAAVLMTAAIMSRPLLSTYAADELQSCVFRY